MKTLPDEVVNFLHKQNFVIVSTIDENGHPHSACKGIVNIDPRGKIYLLDLYSGITHKNLQKDSHISIAAADEHRFIGYCLKGNAKIGRIRSHLLEAWSNKIVSRISHRIVKRLHGEKGHPRHPEISLPKPKHVIVMEVQEIIDLTPGHLK